MTFTQFEMGPIYSVLLQNSHNKCGIPHRDIPRILYVNPMQSPLTVKKLVRLYTFNIVTNYFKNTYKCNTININTSF